MKLAPRDRKYLLILGLALVAAVAVEVFQPTPLDWTPSFERADDRPYGGEILFALLPELFPEAEVQALGLPPYLALRRTEQTGVAYLFVTSRFAPDPAETEALMDFAARGNDVFVAASEFSGALADSLGLEIRTWFVPPSFTIPDSLVARGEANFVHPALRADSAFVFKEEAANAYFSAFDTLRATVLGRDDRRRVNFIRLDWGKGAFYLNTLPLAFTNYYLLDAAAGGYGYRALSYLAPETLWWDAHYKPNRTEVSTPLRFVLQQPALRAAYFVLVVLVVLFIGFEARRRQRVVPVLPPLRNDTLDFVGTVGQLYFHHGDHADLAQKKVTYFLDYIRTHLRLPTAVLDATLATRVAERAGVPPADVEAVFAAVEAVRGQASLPEAELHRLNAAIETFYRKSVR